jgi:phosphoglycerol transferase MdoB-like AlkP superfamily enzyme
MHNHTIRRPPAKIRRQLCGQTKNDYTSNMRPLRRRQTDREHHAFFFASIHGGIVAILMALSLFVQSFRGGEKASEVNALALAAVTPGLVMIVEFIFTLLARKAPPRLARTLWVGWSLLIIPFTLTLFNQFWLTSGETLASVLATPGPRTSFSNPLFLITAATMSLALVLSSRQIRPPRRKMTKTLAPPIRRRSRRLHISSAAAFTALHSTILFALALLLVYADVRASETPVRVDNFAGWGLVTLAYVIATELCVAGMAQVAGRRLGKVVRAAWGLLVLPTTFFVMADFKLFNAFGAHFDHTIIGYVAENFRGALPIAAAELTPAVIASLLAAFGAGIALTVAGWRIQTNRNRRLAVATAAPLAFLAFSINTAVGCIPVDEQASNSPLPYTTSSLNALTEQLSWSECSSATAAENKAAFINALKLTQFTDNVSSDKQFFKNLEAAFSTPLKLKQTEESNLDNVVVIGLESFRADAVTPYTPDLDTTPFLDKLAHEGMMAETSYADFFHTSKSLIAMNCGMPPHPRYTLIENGEDAMPYSCLPELLRPLGYTSAFFQTATKNFEHRDLLVANMKYNHFSSLETTDSTGWETVNYFGIEDRAMIKPMMTWIDEQPGPFLLSIMTLTSHHSYHTPSTFAHKQYEGTPAWNDYLNTVRYTDAFLQDLFAEFERRGLLDNTLFVLTGDHGVGVGYRSSDYPYRENIQVPLIVWSKQRIAEPLIVKGPRQHTDIVPTIVDLLDFGVAEGSFYGRSLLANASDRTIYLACKLNNCQVRIDGNFKLINPFKEGEPPTIFDLKEDPEDKHDLASVLPPGTIEEYQDRLARWRKQVEAMYEQSTQ